MPLSQLGKRVNYFVWRTHILKIRVLETSQAFTNVYRGMENLAQDLGISVKLYLQHSV